jgi:tetratricopeptide (TPR) repeat protein
MLAVREPDLLLSLVGPLRLVRDGADITPRSTKAQGLLALVATSPALRRPRSFLQDKLWSESEPEQGATNLRQVLMHLRRALGPERDALVCEAGWIGLDPRRFAVRLEPGEEDLARPELPEFCDGLDILDPEFEDWIRDCRLAFEERWAKLQAERAARPRPALIAPEAAPVDDPAVVVSEPEAPDAELATLAAAVSAQVAAQAWRLGGITVLLAPFDAAAAPPAGSVSVKVRVARLGRVAIVQALITDLSRGTLLWMAQREFPLGRTRGDPSALGRLVSEVSTALSLEIGRGGPGTEGSAIRRAYRALAGALSFDRDTLLASERDLDLPEGVPGGPVRGAWRANIRLISAIERVVADPQESESEAIELAARALEQDPLNPIVNALAADVALHLQGQPLKAMELARAAVERDGASPFTHASHAQALSRTGSPRAAHEAALRALAFAVGQPNQAWWTMLCCVTATRAGAHDDALRFARVTHEIAPSFRPPLRFMAALLYRARDEAGAAEALRKLKALEPDFSLELMAEDTYPVRTLRECGLLDIVRSGLL